MRGSKIYFISITATVVILFLLQLHLPRKFSWTATFSTCDTNPFGGYVFDSVFSAVIKDYSVTDEPLVDIAKRKGRTGVLAVSADFNYKLRDVRAINEILARGGKVMVVGPTVAYRDSVFVEAFGVQVYNYSHFSIEEMQRQFTANASDTIWWVEKNSNYNSANYRLYPLLSRGHVYVPDSLLPQVNVLACAQSMNSHKMRGLVAVSRNMGKGELIFVSLPLLFTNFGVLDSEMSLLLFRLMSQFDGLPVVRTQAYTSAVAGTTRKTTPLSYILSQPPLREAMYIGLFIIGVFMLMTARRRQRPIPVCLQSRNYTLDFTKLIGTLYFLRNDHTDLVHKKYMFFADELRKTLSVDVDMPNNDKHNFEVIAAQTAIPVTDVAKIIREIRLCCNSNVSINKKEMKSHIDNMNKILKALQ